MYGSVSRVHRWRSDAADSPGVTYDDILISAATARPLYDTLSKPANVTSGALGDDFWRGDRASGATK